MKVKRILLSTVCLVIAFLVVAAGVLLYQLSQTKVRMTKDFAEMIVDDEDMIDHAAMIFPSAKYDQLLQIDYEMRKQVAGYMAENHLKLKSGKQVFIRINPSFEELVDNGENGFQFEPIGE